MDQDRIDDCMRRVRAARNVGLSMKEVAEGFDGVFTPEEVFLAWHAACILDKDVESAPSGPPEKTINMRAQKG